jgi:hypothetical protein
MLKTLMHEWNTQLLCFVHAVLILTRSDHVVGAGLPGDATNCSTPPPPKKGRGSTTTDEHKVGKQSTPEFILEELLEIVSRLVHMNAVKVLETIPWNHSDLDFPYFSLQDEATKQQELTSALNMSERKHASKVTRVLGAVYREAQAAIDAQATEIEAQATKIQAQATKIEELNRAGDMISEVKGMREEQQTNADTTMRVLVNMTAQNTSCQNTLTQVVALLVSSQESQKKQLDMQQQQVELQFALFARGKPDIGWTITTPMSIKSRLADVPDISDDAHLVLYLGSKCCWTKLGCYVCRRSHGVKGIAEELKEPHKYRVLAS